mgnify:CR=1 FL=1
MNCAYPNLAAEMTRANITPKDFADPLGVHITGVYAMLRGDRTFPICKATIVRDKFFPGMTLDYLFDPKPVQPISA